jgi:flavin-dependent dehydrogenase
MYYAYFADFSAPVVPADGAEFSVHGDEMAYVFPSDGGVACIALSLNREMFRWCQADPSTRFVSRLVSHHPGIGARLSRARQEGPLRGVGPAPNFVRRPYGPGWALVGDAETHQDPFAGRGIDTAGQHAALLAEEVLRWHREGGAWEDAGRRYAARRDALSREEYDSTVRLSRDLRAFPFE